MYFPITLVIKTFSSKDSVFRDIDTYITAKSGGMRIIEERYKSAIEEIITINELKQWTNELNNSDIDGIIRDIDIYYKLEMKMDAENEKTDC